MGNNIGNKNTRVGVLIVVVISAAAIVAVFQQQQQQKAQAATIGVGHLRKAPMATSGDNNVYVAWWTNKSGNDEVMFKASIDSGKTFGDKMNLSNSPTSESQDVEIAASGNNVYITWWERNQTMNEPVMRISNDNGKTFGEKIMLSAK